MPRTTSTQWEFGELFPRETGRMVLTVTEITSKIRGLLEPNLKTVWISGEITNLRLQPSGHTYFTLKDVAAQIQCVLFRADGAGTRHLLADGQKLLVHGDVTVYEPRGQYQIRVLKVELQGQGALQEAFERLKRKLESEGLFAAQRKRPIPKYPQRIGVVTSIAGAALRDVLHVIRRRNPGLEIFVAPCQVQGSGAAGEIAAAIALLNDWSSQPQPSHRMDLILVTRGGGSLEDLWAFNEEIVARAIFNSHLPVLSAVGHEIDFTISDFVADLRAATPSAGAEIITEGAVSSAAFLAKVSVWMPQQAARAVQRRSVELEGVMDRMNRCHPRRRLEDQSIALDEAASRLVRSVRTTVRSKTSAAQSVLGRFVRLRPEISLRRRRETLDVARTALLRLHRLSLERRTSRLTAALSRLQLLSPQQTLGRGYSITMDDKSGVVIRRSEALKPGQKLRTRFAEGEVRSTVG